MCTTYNISQSNTAKKKKGETTVNVTKLNEGRAACEDTNVVQRRDYYVGRLSEQYKGVRLYPDVGGSSTQSKDRR